MKSELISLKGKSFAFFSDPLLFIFFQKIVCIPVMLKPSVLPEGTLKLKKYIRSSFGSHRVIGQHGQLSTK